MRFDDRGAGSPIGGGIVLDAPWLVAGLVVVAVVLVVLVPARWRRWRHRRTGRTGSVLAATLTVVLAAAGAVNTAGDFYPTLGTLVPAAVPAQRALAVAPTAGAGQREHGTVSRVTVPWSEEPLTVYRPPGGWSPDIRFPVLRWLSDVPFGTTSLPAALDAAIADGHLPPVVVVQPPATTPADVVTRWAVAELDARPEPMAWALAGPARAADCPLDAASAWPDAYVAAVGRSCRTGPAGRTPAQLLAVATADHPVDVAAADWLHAQAPAGAQVATYVFPATATDDTVLAAELQWLGARLLGPVAASEASADAQR